jgi:hypothetical protein
MLMCSCINHKFVPIAFGGSVALTTGQTLPSLPSGLMDIDCETTSSNNEFVVLFSDVGNNGAISTVSGQVQFTLIFTFK